MSSNWTYSPSMDGIGAAAWEEELRGSGSYGTMKSISGEPSVLGITMEITTGLL